MEKVEQTKRREVPKARPEYRTPEVVTYREEEILAHMVHGRKKKIFS